MATTKNIRVKSWLPVIREVRSSMGLAETQYADEVILALIDVESDGQPYANRNKKNGQPSQFVGLLQIGTDNGAEFGLDPRSLLSMSEIEAGRTSIRHFLRVMEKYSSRHDYEPSRMAILWKGGSGTAKTYERMRDRENATEAELQAFLKSRWGTDGYVRKFEREWAFWKSQGESVPQSAVNRSPGVSTSLPFTSEARTPDGKLIFSQGVTTPDGCAGTTTIGQVSVSPPLVEARPKTVSTANLARARKAKTTALAYIERSYLQDLAVYKEGSYVRYRTKNGFSERGYRRVAAFVDSAVAGAYEQSFRAIFEDAVTAWVRPLVDPVIGNSPWGKKRNFPARARSPGEKKIILRDPTTNEKLFRRHFGVDYATTKNGRGKNQPCYAIADGTVIRAAKSKSYGLVIYINHGDGVTSRYAHLRRFNVKRGDTVKAGQVIGVTGQSEGTTNPNGKGYTIDHNKLFPHLHFELRLNIKALQGKPVSRSDLFGNVNNISIDPEPLFSVCPNPGEVREELPAELSKALEARDAAAELVSVSSSAEGRVQALIMYDNATARLRGEQLASASRKQFYDAHLKQQDVLRDNASRRMRIVPEALDA